MYQPTTRLLTVLELLQARGSVTGPELARLLEVDARSVRRYIVSLQDLGIPVEGTPGPGGGYRIRPGHRTAPLLFTEPEAVATTLGLLALRAAGPAVDAAAREGAIAKLERVLPVETRAAVEALRGVAVEPHPGGERPDGAVIALLAGAARRGQRVHLAYVAADGTRTERDVDPYGIAIALDHWYVAGWCHLRGDVRSFRLDRIADARLVDAAFTPPVGFDALVHVTSGIAAMPTRWVAEVRFLLPLAEVAARIPRALALLVDDGETTIARVPSDDPALTARWLAGLGIPMRLAGPPEVAAAMADLARSLLASASP
ncbi:MAG: YafY family protein [Chloroflexota bacterium]